MLTPNFIVLSGDGVNCERETAHALELAGASAQIVHINVLLKDPSSLMNYQGMALPGGFSFGDELGSGQLLALKIRHALKDQFQEFVERKHPIIGICNGFQVLCKLDMFPGVALARNRDGHFINRWVDLKVNEESVCHWTKECEQKISLPVRHGEGRLIFKDRETFERMEAKGQIVLRYQQNINGSEYSSAGVCDERGLVFGLMPHPEAYLYELLKNGEGSNPLAKGQGVTIFDSIVRHLKER